MSIYLQFVPNMIIAVSEAKFQRHVRHVKMGQKMSQLALFNCWQKFFTSISVFLQFCFLHFCIQCTCSNKGRSIYSKRNKISCAQWFFVQNFCLFSLLPNCTKIQLKAPIFDNSIDRANIQERHLLAWVWYFHFH